MTTAAAAFGRLCVETVTAVIYYRLLIAAAFGRLCVETSLAGNVTIEISQPPSGGCVLKLLNFVHCFPF